MQKEQIQALIEAARSVRGHAHAPYSNYQVGAALLDDQGRIHLGVNVENSAYPTTLCAERCALGTAVAAGARKLVAIAVVTQPDASGQPGSPCGNCRQALSEFGGALRVFLATPEGPAEAKIERTLEQLLPLAFSSESL